mmetsp:Transcript_8043/g.7987  ORF Transcript_8043/g.7987 Transcript_8043/m.7987 type:complete len:163 (+) Transcript_8043:47-535(+)
MADIYEYSLEKLDKLEGDDIRLNKFDSAVCWKLGSIARDLSIERYPKKAVVIDISLASGQVLFHSVTNDGTSLDNDQWIARKKRTVLRFGKSSFYIGQKLRIKKLPMEDALFVSPIDYASHGGSVPIRVKGVDGVIGTLTISGLAQEEDHLLAIEVLTKGSN